MCCRKRSGLRLRLHLPKEMKREPETAPKYGGPRALRATPINAASSLQVNGERDWPCLARVHAQAGFFCPASGFHSHNRPATNRRLRELCLRVQAEHHDVLPQVPGPDHGHDALLLGLDMTNALEFCKGKHLVISGWTRSAFS